MVNESRNQHIKEANAATRERRKHQFCLMVGLKVNYSHCTYGQKKYLPGVLIEKKRIQNNILDLSRKVDEYEAEDTVHTEEELAYLASLENQIIEEIQSETISSQEEPLDIFKAKPCDFKTVDCYIRTKNEKTGKYEPKYTKNYACKYAGSFVRLDSVVELRESIKGLSTLKEHGNKVGSLKYKTDVRSIRFLCLKNGFDVNIGDSTVRLQGCKKPLKVYGIKQLSEIKAIDSEYEFGAAYLIKKSDKDYYINLAVYVDKKKYVTYKRIKEQNRRAREKEKEDLKYKTISEENIQNKSHSCIGIDFGCMTSFTTSDGRKFNFCVEETERLKKLQRNFARCEKGSNNAYILKKKINREYVKIEWQKKELTNQFIDYLFKTGKKIIIQDENLNGWKVSGHGKAVQHSILGRVKEKLLNHRLIDVIVLDKSIPTTKLCHECGCIHTTIKQSDRIYVCPDCGAVSDRDVHAAENMVWIYENCVKYNIIPADAPEITRADFDRLRAMVFRNSSDRVADMPVDLGRKSLRHSESRATNPAENFL